MSNLKFHGSHLAAFRIPKHTSLASVDIGTFAPSILGQLALYRSARCGTYISMVSTNELKVRKIQLVLADDHRVVREQLDTRLQREPDFEIVGVASNSRETWQETQSKRPHILLVDPLMRDGLGLATLRQVRTYFPDLVVVVLTAYVDTALNMQFQEMGIKSVLTKGISSSELVGQLRVVYIADSIEKYQP